MGRIRRTIKSFRFAGQGLSYLLRTQPNFLIHCLAAVLVVALAVALGTTRPEIAVLILTIGVVLVCEALNTALEALVDLASPSYHPLARIAKDVAAGGVLIAAIVAAAVGLMILGPPLLQRLWPGIV